MNNILIIVNIIIICKSFCILNELVIKYNDDNIKNIFKILSKWLCNIGIEEFIIIIRINIFIKCFIFNGCGFDL